MLGGAVGSSASTLECLDDLLLTSPCFFSAAAVSAVVAFLSVADDGFTLSSPTTCFVYDDSVVIEVRLSEPDELNLLAAMLLLWRLC